MALWHTKEIKISKRSFMLQLIYSKSDQESSKRDETGHNKSQFIYYQTITITVKSLDLKSLL